jgi:hypothetical protein
MARTLLAGVLVAAAALGAVEPAAAGRPPIVRSLSVVHRHVVLELSVGDVRPTELIVAKRRAIEADGALVPNSILLRQAIQLPPSAAGVVRWRSRRELRPGAYFIQVEAVETEGGVTDCPPKQRTCNERWSSVRRVVVPKAS